MNLITCKKPQGGNSLKLGVEGASLGGRASSRAAGGLSSSGRIGRLFSFILSVALLFGASGAWAADWTDANGNKYTALKYIKGNGSGSSGGPYIITDFKPVSNSTVKLRFKPTTVSGNECLFCSRKKVSNKVSDSMSGFRISNKIRLDRRHTDRYETCNTTTLAAENDYSLSADFSGSGTATTGIATINGVDQTLSGVLGNVAYTPASKLTLFASHEDADVSASSTFSNKGSFYLYYFQLYSPDDGSLAHNLMPAQNSSGVAGLYDTVTRTFYGPTGPDGYTAFTTEAYAVRTGKKWTGAAGDGLMSTAANWQGGSAPVEGEALDFTIAVPNASIVADIEDVTFGKIYLGTGDLPAFSGALSATGINDLERMTAYDTATGGFAFTLAAPSGKDFTWNGGAAANWNTTDASWLYNNAASVWYDYNNAIFSTENATVALTENAIADSLSFTQPATIVGSAVLTVPAVSVAPNVSATISAPIASAFEKTGAGTLTLGSSRTDQTTLSEGTLAMSGSGTTLDWSKLTLGTDPEKPVTVRFEDGAAPTSGAWHLGSGNITSTVVKASGDWARGDKDIHIGSGVGADTTFIHEGGSLTCSGFIRVGTSGAANSTLILSGGVITNSNTQTGSGREPRTAIGYTSDGTLIVTNGASLAVTGQYLGISDANRMKGIVEIYDGSTVDVAYAVIFGQVSQQGWGEGKLNLHAGGTLATQVIRCSTNYATPADATAEVNFDGGILKANSSTRFIQKHDRLTVNVSAKGGTINNNGMNIIIEESFNGPGTINLTGSGTTSFAAGVGAEGGVSVANGTTLALDVTGQSSLGSLTLAAGSKLALEGVMSPSLGVVTLAAGSIIEIATPATDVAAFAATALNLPAEGKVTLTSGGEAFGEGLYAICKMSGVTAEAGEKFAPVTGDLVASWSVVDGDTLMLTVGAVDGNTWTGGANNGNLSDPKNWYGGKVPESGTVTINTTGTLTVGDTFRPDVVVFPETCGAVTIAGENAITGIMAITNLSSSICTFEVPVEFADKILVIQNAVDWSTRDQSSVRFAGGVTGTDFAEGTARYLNGAYTLTAAEDWIANTQGNKDRWGIPKGSSLTLPFSSDTSEIALGEHGSETGGAFTAAVVRTSARVSCWNRGEYVVTEELAVTLSDANRHISYRGGEGAYKLEKLTLGDKGESKWFYFANSGDYYGDKNIWIGAGGLNFLEGTSVSTAYACGRRNSDVIRVYPWYSDYAIGTKAGSKTDIQIQKKTHFGTTDEDGVARTVTCNGIMGGNAAVSIEGAGRFVVNNVNTASSAVTVTDTATLAINAGKQMTSGALTVDSGATLEVASGVNTFGGLTLNDGATLAFNFTQRAITPQIAVAEGKTPTVNGAVKVKIPADSKWPTSGEKVLTTCGGFTADKVSLVGVVPKWVRGLSVNAEGNIVLDVKPMGTRVIVR